MRNDMPTNDSAPAALMDLNRTKIVVHPLVLLSVVDHYQRVAKGTSKRVVGALLGECKEGELHVTNSFAVPFEEDPKDAAVTFIDGLYYQELSYMFKKINTKEKFVGWYSTGATISPGDLKLHNVFRELARGHEPIFCLVNVCNNSTESSVPVKVYYETFVPCSDDRFLSSFQLLAKCEIHGSEAEEVAVEHLIREIKETQALSFKGRLQGHHSAIKEYAANLKLIKQYLEDISSGRLSPNQTILTACQDILTYLPSFQSDVTLKGGHREISDETDVMQYLGSLTIAVISLHDLLESRSNKGTSMKPVPRTKQVIDHTC
eukprot:GHVH01000860.1.p1 GENE.GHVH01000860.1~~GHVH01000860.1.p1  ORF type:complete len:319 (-),score=48.87 GHVH01000860.1:73-1029(-)